MDKINLHADGRKDFLQNLKFKLFEKILAIKNYKSFSEDAKQIEIKKIKKAYEIEKENSLNNLF